MQHDQSYEKARAYATNLFQEDPGTSIDTAAREVEKHCPKGLPKDILRDIRRGVQLRIQQLGEGRGNQAVQQSYHPRPLPVVQSKPAFQVRPRPAPQPVRPAPAPFNPPRIVAVPPAAPKVEEVVTPAAEPVKATPPPTPAPAVEVKPVEVKPAAEPTEQKTGDTKAMLAGLGIEVHPEDVERYTYAFELFVDKPESNTQDINQTVKAKFGKGFFMPDLKRVAAYVRREMGLPETLVGIRKQQDADAEAKASAPKKPEAAKPAPPAKEEKPMVAPKPQPKKQETVTVKQLVAQLAEAMASEGYTELTIAIDAKGKARLSYERTEVKTTRGSSII